MHLNVYYYYIGKFMTFDFDLEDKDQPGLKWTQFFSTTSFLLETLVRQHEIQSCVLPHISKQR